MAYVPTTFVDRSVEFPNRRKFTAVSGQADTFDIARAEGTVFAEGTKPDAANLNAEFEKIKTETDSINTSLTAPTVGMFIYDYQDGQCGYNTDPSRGADTFRPFSGAPEVVAFLKSPPNVTAYFIASDNYYNMIVAAADSRAGDARIKINNTLADVTETTLSGDRLGYITINQKINSGDRISITPIGGESNNLFWFIA